MAITIAPALWSPCLRSPWRGGPAGWDSAQFRPCWDKISTGLGRLGCCRMKPLCLDGGWRSTARHQPSPSSQTPLPASPRGGSRRSGSLWTRPLWPPWRPAACPAPCPGEGGTELPGLTWDNRTSPQNPMSPIPAANPPLGWQGWRCPQAMCHHGIWCPHSHSCLHAPRELTRGTSSPFSMMACSFLPRSEPELTSARSRSPVERWV